MYILPVSQSQQALLLTLNSDPLMVTVSHDLQPTTELRSDHVDGDHVPQKLDHSYMLLAKILLEGYVL